ncbi:hypothetical protein FSP39_000734 [Pinctada imbricata]|uniref:Uncharacterized protein n=1 Tax=Pinctada imbricata TaxID=66713 RepID=A0AA88YHA2_PINIB|nr:hypothetical protein FSP39_000734 [Pinctada imbricata]
METLFDRVYLRVSVPLTLQSGLFGISATACPVRALIFVVGEDTDIRSDKPYAEIPTDEDEVQQGNTNESSTEKDNIKHYNDDDDDESENSYEMKDSMNRQATESNNGSNSKPKANQDITGTKANKQKPPPYEKKQTPDMGVRPGAQEEQASPACVQHPSLQFGRTVTSGSFHFGRHRVQSLVGWFKWSMTEYHPPFWRVGHHSV